MTVAASTTRRARRRMVRRDLAARGITDRRVLAVMAAIPREGFVPDALRDKAYADVPLPIGGGQTISQPFVVALMTAEAGVCRTSRVLEVGTGCGYQTAVLAKLAEHVWTIERIPRFWSETPARLDRLGFRNVTFVHGDGAFGVPAAAPFDAILVTAAAPRPPQALMSQLALGGRLVIPIGDLAAQELITLQWDGRDYRRRSNGPVRFVPLISPDGFHHGD